MHWSSRILVSGLAAAILCGVPDPAAAVGFYVGGHVGYGSFTQEDLKRWEQEFMSVVKKGRELWVSPELGTNGVACAQCHPNAANRASDR